MSAALKRAWRARQAADESLDDTVPVYPYGTPTPAEREDVIVRVYVHAGLGAIVGLAASPWVIAAIRSWL